MFDDKFSRSAFESAGYDTVIASQLVSDLEDAILAEMDDVIRGRFLQIVQRLNDMGHCLRPYVPLAPGELSFRDDEGKEGTSSYKCNLRVALDYVISAGYSHLTVEN